MARHRERVATLLLTVIMMTTVAFFIHTHQQTSAVPSLLEGDVVDDDAEFEPEEHEDVLAETSLTETDTLFMFPTSQVPGRSQPYYATNDIANGHPTATRAILVIHGTNRNADDYYARAVRGATDAGATDHVFIVAPKFTLKSESPSDDTIFWDSNSRWKKGHKSSSSLSQRTSSFQVLDDILAALSDRTKFPKIDRIVITGHSAGGQVAQRHALGSSADVSVTAVKFRWVPMNPSSYAYLDAKRSVDGSNTSYAVPSATVIAECKYYDEWKYGLEDLNSFMTAVGADTARTRYKARDVVYALGMDDNDPAAKYLDTTCSAELQGANRYSRGEIMFGAVQNHFGAQPHQFVAVPAVGHSSSQMLRNAATRPALFE